MVSCKVPRGVATASSLPFAGDTHGSEGAEPNNGSHRRYYPCRLLSPDDAQAAPSALCAQYCFIFARLHEVVGIIIIIIIIMSLPMKKLRLG